MQKENLIKLVNEIINDKSEAQTIELKVPKMDVLLNFLTHCHHFQIKILEG